MAKLSIGGDVSFGESISMNIKACDDACKHGVYMGAKVVADNLRVAVMSLPVERFRFILYEGDAPANVSSEIIRDELANSIGISPIKDDDGNWSASISFNGYSSITTEAYPNGIPLALIARSISKGTSYHRRNAFIKQNMAHSKPAALSAMEKAAKEILDKENK